MTRETYEKDLRRVDEVVIETGKFLQEDYRTVNIAELVLKSLYWVSVAVWHLLQDKIKEKEK